MNFPKMYKDFLESNANGLIGGVCGSGKSVLLNGIILYGHCTNTYFVYIDPKKVELRQYTNSSHCLAYADNERSIIKVLKQVITEMNNRFKWMQRHEAKKYNGYKIIIVIDELADLMNSPYKKEINSLLVKISTLGRASNIFILAATQKVRAVITPWLRTNFDYRIGLRCVSKLESNGIIETSGCENLPRYGSALVRSPNYCELVEIEIPFYTDADIKAFIKDT